MIYRGSPFVSRLGGRDRSIWFSATPLLFGWLCPEALWDRPMLGAALSKRRVRGGRETRVRYAPLPAQPEAMIWPPHPPCPTLPPRAGNRESPPTRVCQVGGRGGEEAAELSKGRWEWAQRGKRNPPLQAPPVITPHKPLLDALKCQPRKRPSPHHCSFHPSGPSAGFPTNPLPPYLGEAQATRNVPYFPTYHTPPQIRPVSCYGKK